MSNSGHWDEVAREGQGAICGILTSFSLMPGRGYLESWKYPKLTPMRLYIHTYIYICMCIPSACKCIGGVSLHIIPLFRRLLYISLSPFSHFTSPSSFSDFTSPSPFSHFTTPSSFSYFSSPPPSSLCFLLVRSHLPARLPEIQTAPKTRNTGEACGTLFCLKRLTSIYQCIKPYRLVAKNCQKCSF